MKKIETKTPLILFLITAVITVSGCASLIATTGGNKMPGDCKLVIDPNANTYEMEGGPECVQLLLKSSEKTPALRKYREEPLLTKK